MMGFLSIWNIAFRKIKFTNTDNIIFKCGHLIYYLVWSFFTVIFCPYFPHILDAWAKRTHPNLLFIFYEDMKKNLRGEVEKVARFLGKPLTEENMTKLLEHLKFENISKNESVNFEIGKKIGFMNLDGAFMRKGIWNQFHGMKQFKFLFNQNPFILI